MGQSVARQLLHGRHSRRIFTFATRAPTCTVRKAWPFKNCLAALDATAPPCEGDELAGQQRPPGADCNRVTGRALPDYELARQLSKVKRREEAGVILSPLGGRTGMSRYKGGTVTPNRVPGCVTVLPCHLVGGSKRGTPKRWLSGSKQNVQVCAGTRDARCRVLGQEGDTVAWYPGERDGSF